MADAEAPRTPAADDEAPAMNKAAQRAAAKKAKAAARAAKAEAPTKADPDDPLADRYGDSEMVQSRGVTGRAWTDVGALGADKVGETVLVRARVHTARGTGKNCFLVLRQGWSTVQAVLFADGAAASKPMVKYAARIPKESLVDVEGSLVAPKEPVAACSQSDVEIQVTGVHCVSRAAELPFQITDASRSEEEVKKAADAGEQFATVLQDTRLNHRYLDLRTPANQGIFRLQSGVCQLFREILLAKGFCEVHTPKLIAGASEGGAAVFKVQYMGQPACLAQSPQLYKQMAICSDLGRVFEIGPVFRAETSNTHRHLCEFTGLDFEMAIHEHYFEVLDVVEDLFMAMFEGLRTRHSRELAAIASQFPFEPFEAKPLRLPFVEGIKMLQAAGHDVDPLGDLSTETEKALGALVKEEHGTDFYILHRYPSAVRPFYTMPCADDPDYSNSFDVFMRGEEIISGAQRIHDPTLLVERAKACEVPVETIQAYVDSFKLGAPPHGGIGVGLERVVMLYCGLNNIRKTSMFPRDPKRLSP